MHTYFIFIPNLNPWRQHRVVSACRAFLDVLDPGFETEPLDLDGVRVGWFFHTTTEEARQRLIVFFTGLVGKVAEDRSFGNPAILDQYDAAVTHKRFSEVAR